ncbi:hypothetical protein DSL72_007581 [Monilinia vaccinii-corymbosi]|uniref:NADP-dependent oxidoreductase domain-containing protein n=1 Tax=Monilinia vaccinii-corymbosi TaxID=61207 RepID=A0A8A3PIE0_9HELO|nr:hypothetical protein DSL72_007581 [Monilinia vaccinii-corymbosi]
MSSEAALSQGEESSNINITINSKLFSKLEGLNTVGIPQLGFGVYQSHGQKCIDAIIAALRAGYRHIDTAQIMTAILLTARYRYYANEKEVGIAVKEFIKESGIDRSDIFIATKILSPGGSVDESHRKCLESIEAIDGKDGYVDLFLIHSPNSGSKGRKEMWQALERLYTSKKVRMIGVSNWGIGHIEELKSFAEVWPPAVNQIELHPFCQQRAAVDYCVIHNIHVEAYCPLVRNKRSDDPTLNLLANTHKKTTAQVLIRYALQKGWIPLPKSETPSRIVENANVYDFNLSQDEMQKLDNLDERDQGAIVVAVSNEL